LHDPAPVEVARPPIHYDPERSAGNRAGALHSFEGRTMISKPALTLDDAKRIAAAAHAEAKKNGWPVTIAIVDDGANLLYLERLDGCKLGAVVTAQEKARSAALFARPTKALEDIVAGGRNAMLKLPGATPIQGGLPLEHEGALVGGIGVSGVASAQDEHVAAAGLRALA